MTCLECNLNLTRQPSDREVIGLVCPLCKEILTGSNTLMVRVSVVLRTLVVEEAADQVPCGVCVCVPREPDAEGRPSPAWCV